MNTSPSLRSNFAILMSMSILGGTLAPLVTMQSAIAQTRLSDISGLWAEGCINALAQRNIINGYPDGSFRPNAPVTRAEFATLVATAFPSQPDVNSGGQFRDISSGYWASNAIRTAYQKGFLSGYPDGRFEPNQNIPRAQALIALSSGLQYRPRNSVDQTLSAQFNDAAAIPSYARNGIAAATEQEIVVNYPNVRNLRPNAATNRAEMASFLCQALNPSGQMPLISSQYISGYQTTTALTLPAGQRIEVFYSDAERIIVSANETAPVTLQVAQALRNQRGEIVIPQGSQIKGKLEPREQGSQFVAESVVIDGQDYPLNASSPVINRTTTARDPNLVSLARNAVLGAGAAAGLSAVIGNRNITAPKVLSGAALGTAVETNKGRAVTSILRDTAIGAAIATGVSTIVGNETITADKVISGAAAGATLGGVIDPARQRVVIIDPNTDLSLTLNQDLTINP